MKVDEEWRPIEGTNEEYWVSSLGRVMSKKRGRTWLLKPINCVSGRAKSACGYYWKYKEE